LTVFRGDYYYHDPVERALVKVLMEHDTVDNAPGIIIRADNLQTLPIRPFMIFTIKGAVFPDKEEHSNAIKMTLPPSFAHKLTNVGCEVLGRLKNNIMSRFAPWTSTTAKSIAPISSICQYSGSGKSKLTSELTKEGPGVRITKIRFLLETICL
jgi:hypothetical protein